MKHYTVAALGFAFQLFALLPAVAQNVAWVKQLGTNTHDSVYGAGPDDSGGVYVSGVTASSLGGPSAGFDDAWLAHYDSNGSRTWLRQIGTSNTEEARAATSDGSGGVFVGGFTEGSLGGVSAGSRDAWLARFDSTGTQTWIRQFGTNSDEMVFGLAADSSGGVYVIGSSWGDLGGPSAGGLDAWLARYDGAGTQLWIRQFGTNGGEWAFAGAPDGSGGVYVTGETGGSLGAPQMGSGDVWVARYDGGGNQSWIRQIGTSGYDTSYGAAEDATGGIYVSGFTAGDLGGTNAGTYDVWLARYDNTGNQSWIRQIGTSNYEYAQAAAPDASGGVYVTGITDASLGGPNMGMRDSWLARYDGTGNQLWIRQFGTSNYDWAFTAAHDGAGGAYVGGYTFGDFGGPSAGNADAWLTRYASTPVSYCTPKTNSLGCVPAIGWTGTPSSTGPVDDFHITATDVLNRKPGIMLWSTQPGSTPLGGGTLCLAPPVIRTPGQSSGGSPAPIVDCSGQYSFHFGHAHIQTYFLPVGQTIRAQYWSRDPGFPAPNNIGLTNGLAFVIGP